MIDTIRKFYCSGRVSYSRHALDRIVERFVSEDDISNVILNGKIIQGPCGDPKVKYLLMGTRYDKVGEFLHMVIAVRLDMDYIKIVTIYIPEPDKWDETLTIRKEEQK